jgi:hypothetical protein
MPVRERILDTRGQTHDGDARNVQNAKRGDAEVGMDPDTNSDVIF